MSDETTIGPGRGRVAGKVAIVTGGGTREGAEVGTGRAAALTLAREGAQVLIADLDVANAERTPSTTSARRAGKPALARSTWQGASSARRWSPPRSSVTVLCTCWSTTQATPTTRPRAGSRTSTRRSTARTSTSTSTARFSLPSMPFRAWPRRAAAPSSTSRLSTVSSPA